MERHLRLAEAEKGSMSSSMVCMLWIGELQAYFFSLPGLKCIKTQGEGVVPLVGVFCVPHVGLR